MKPTKYLATKSLTSPWKWGTMVLQGTIFDVADIDRPGIDLEHLTKQEAIRLATADEIAAFDRKYPSDLAADAKHSEGIKKFKVDLEARALKARSLPDKAGLALQLVLELGHAEAQVKGEAYIERGSYIGLTEDQLIGMEVRRNRCIRRLVAPCELLKKSLKELLEPLIVATEGLDDPQLVSLPLTHLMEHWDQQYPVGPNPAFYAAEELLKRLRPKFASRQQHSRPPLARSFAAFNATISHPIVSTVIGAVIVGAIAIVIYLRWGVNVMDPAGSRALSSQSTTQAAR